MRLYYKFAHAAILNCVAWKLRSQVYHIRKLLKRVSHAINDFWCFQYGSKSNSNFSGSLHCVTQQISINLTLKGVLLWLNFACRMNISVISLNIFLPRGEFSQCRGENGRERTLFPCDFHIFAIIFPRFVCVLVALCVSVLWFIDKIFFLVCLLRT